MDILRWVTIHPILVHLTIGGIPLMLVAYAVAARNRSGTWLFAGDFVLIATAIVTVFTGLFGFVAFFVLDWPGGLGLWRWLHLGLGVATAALIWVMGALRWRARKRNELPNYQGLVGGSAMALLLATLAGWVGGEVLVYRAGVAVIGAQNGALAPPVLQPRSAPSNLDDAMGRIRSHFAAAIGEQFEMIAHEPTPERFRVVGMQARRLQELARWVSVSAERAESQHEHQHDHGQQPGGQKDQSMLTLAAELESAASELERAANGEDLVQLSHALDSVESTCVSCHVEHRWQKEEEMRAQR